MAATNQDIKDFFALTGNNDAVTDPQLIRLQTWLDNEANLTDSSADDFIDWVYNTLVEKITEREHSIAQDQVSKPSF